MEMDIPLPEELEWLESNALTPEDAAVPEEDFLDEDDELLELCKAIPDDNGGVGPASKIQTRQRGEGGGGPGSFFQELESAGKRSKLSSTAADGVVEEDEDWLRYSPARNGGGVEGDDDVGGGDGSVEVDVEERIVCRFASEIDGDCIPVTGLGGDRVYAKMDPVVVDIGPPRSRTFERLEKGLLLESINVIMERVEEEALGKVLHESFGSPSDGTTSSKLMVNEQLWVEKYAPNSFTELLSDEQTNREVLLWLKQWDSCVFGSHVRATTDDVLYALKRHSSLAQAQYRRFSDNMSHNKNKGVHFENHKFNQSNVLDKQTISLQESLESSTRNSTVTSPLEYKVLLLCGPPGLGKTTLAHIAAKHCGYRVVEINASDERSSSTIESKILDVVQMNSVMTDSKPKCLIIDEIDGALGEGKGAVEVILKMVLAEKNSSHENNNLVGPSGKVSKKGRKTAKLSRPVICICNDLYAPALRLLRQVAKVHVFVQPTTYRVVNRLKHICRMESFKTSTIALTALAEYTECDIRSCLNTLQFLHKKKEPLNFLEVDAQVVGRKDISRTVYDVWKEIFQKKKPKREKKSNNKLGTTGDFEFVYSLVSNRGEYELTMDGIYENFLQLSYHDPFMRKSASCLDVLGISDSLLWYTMRTQQMSLNAYQPFVAISMRNLIAQVNRPNIEWPKSIQRFRMMAMEKKERLKLWHNKLSPSIARHLSIESFVEDVVTPLLHILSPPTLKPVALHLLSERERDDLSQLVDTMVSYSLTYKSTSERMPKSTKHGENFDVQLLYLEPPINNFISFKDYQPGHYGLSMAIKQVLVHEVEKYRILCESTGRSSNQNNGSSDKNQTSSSGTTGLFSEKTNKITPSAGKKMQPENKLTSDANRNSAAVGIKLKAPANSKKSSGRSYNFFDRFRKHEDTGSPEISKPATMERDLRPLLFKYNEGFTNAVKRPVRMRELLF